MNYNPSPPSIQEFNHDQTSSNLIQFNTISDLPPNWTFTEKIRGGTTKWAGTPYTCYYSPQGEEFQSLIDVSDYFNYNLSSSYSQSSSSSSFHATTSTNRYKRKAPSLQERSSDWMSTNKKSRTKQSITSNRNKKIEKIRNENDPKYYYRGKYYYKDNDQLVKQLVNQGLGPERKPSPIHGTYLVSVLNIFLACQNNFFF